jgi:DNA repair exonuclease SbcCD ATPase subunit
MNILAKINVNNTFLLNMPETIRQLKEKQEELRKQQESWKKYYEEKEIQRLREIKREFEVFRQKIENSTIDKRELEQLIRTSSIIKDLRESISRIRELFDAIPVGLTQAAVDAAIATSEKDTMKREHTIEQLARGVGEQVKKLENRLNELSTTTASSSQTISRAEIEKLIHQAIQNFKSTGQNDNNEPHKLLREMNDRLSQLEKRFDQLPQPTSIDNNQTKDNELNSQKTMENQSTTQKSSLSQPEHRRQSSEVTLNPYSKVSDRLNVPTNNETKVNDSICNVPLVGNASQIQPMVSTSTLQNRTNQHPGSVQELSENKKNISEKRSNQTTVPQFIDGRKEGSKDQKNKSTNDADREFHYDDVPELQEKLNDYSIAINNLQNQIDNINKTKPSQQTVDDLLKAGEQRNEKKINDLQKCVNENGDHLSKFNIDLTALRRHLAQQPTSTSLPSTNKDLFTGTYTEEEFQAIMPFIEPLSTLDIFLENEWDGIC